MREFPMKRTHTNAYSSLPGQFQAELDLSRGRGCAVQQTGSRDHRCAVEIATGVGSRREYRDVVDGWRKIRVIQDVEHLRPELYVKRTEAVLAGTISIFVLPKQEVSLGFW